MEMMKSIGALAATALAILFFALVPSTASAQSYTGNYPLTWSISSGFTGTHTYCLTLTDNGTGGFPHSGPATATGNYVITSSEGSFAVINNELVVTFYIAGGYGTIGDVVFVAPARNGVIGAGFGEYAADGAFTDLGALTVGKAGGCGTDAGAVNKDEQPKARASNKKG
jgi:hypothetical protein